jgi:hypothetical protein
VITVCQGTGSKLAHLGRGLAGSRRFVPHTVLSAGQIHDADVRYGVRNVVDTAVAVVIVVRITRKAGPPPGTATGRCAIEVGATPG